MRSSLMGFALSAAAGIAAFRNAFRAGGETQALASVTLGSGDDAQRIDSILTMGATKSFMLHYNFPPFSVGEVKFLRRHDRVMGTVKKDGKTILDCALVDPQPVSGTDVQYINWVTAANAPLDGQTQPRLLGARSSIAPGETLATRPYAWRARRRRAL